MPIGIIERVRHPVSRRPVQWSQTCRVSVVYLRTLLINNLGHPGDLHTVEGNVVGLTTLREPWLLGKAEYPQLSSLAVAGWDHIREDADVLDPSNWSSAVCRGSLGQALTGYPNCGEEVRT